MRNRVRVSSAILKVSLLLAVLGFGLGAAQAQSTKAPARKAPANAAAAAGQASQEELAATRKDLIDLLRMNPKMASFVKRDPALLGDEEYVARNNPKLAEFLLQHREIMQTPEFYLFADLGNGGGIRDVYVDESPWTITREESSPDKEIVLAILVFLGFVVILSVLVWLLRVLLENRRWSRIFKVQTEIYNKLLDKFSTNDEMLAYIRSESGKRFLDSATLPVVTGMRQTSNPVGRVLMPLQLGVTLALIGFGSVYLRSSIPHAHAPLSLFGTLALMAGLGLIISAGLAFGLATHLGLMPQPGAQPESGQHPEIP